MRVAREGRVAKHLPDLFGQSDFICNDLLSYCSPLVPLFDISASSLSLCLSLPLSASVSLSLTRSDWPDTTSYMSELEYRAAPNASAKAETLARLKGIV